LLGIGLPLKTGALLSDFQWPVMAISQRRLSRIFFALLEERPDAGAEGEPTRLVVVY
jgi:hypothetical protein